MDDVAKKPFDVKDLEAKLIAMGMPAMEGLAKAAAEALFDWIEDGIKATDSKIDDMALIALPPLRAFVLSKLDGISA